MKPARGLPITDFVAVDDVIKAVGCSQSLAYEYLRRAAGRSPGQRGLLRVSVRTWESFARKHIAQGESAADETRASTARVRSTPSRKAPVGTGTSGRRRRATTKPPIVLRDGSRDVLPIQITRPRTKPR